MDTFFCFLTIAGSFYNAPDFYFIHFVGFPPFILTILIRCGKVLYSYHKYCYFATYIDLIGCLFFFRQANFHFVIQQLQIRLYFFSCFHIFTLSEHKEKRPKIERFKYRFRNSL